MNGVASLPTVGTSSTGGKTYLTLTYTRLIAATDLTCTVEVSGDLATWASGAGSTAVVSTVNNADGKTQTITVRDLTAQTGTARRFIHLKVTQP